VTAVWEAGKTYVPGSLVRPVTAPSVASGQPTNPSFENGATGWTLPAGFSVTGNAHYGDGASALQYDGSGQASATSTDQRPVTPGQTITASVMVQQGKSSSGKAGAAALLLWYDASHNAISYDAGNTVDSGSGGDWGRSSVTAAAPAGSAFVAVGISCAKNSGFSMWVDDVEWDYNYFVPSAGLVYKAVQPNPGKSASNEPTWPPTLGQQVIDNEVIWEAVSASQIVWMARPINKSGAFEPNWPLVTGGFVHDGTIDWVADTPQIKDPNCPHSKIVAIAASKVYAADKDIIRYCATVNPLDWTTANDAGYLPYGLQNYGSNPAAAMNLYRSNLAVFNSEGMQLWQVDEDPASSALLDALPVGSTQNLALSPVSNDLIFLSSQGVRSIGIASGSTNLQAGDIGMPIDPLVKEGVLSAPGAPLSTYVPSMGQYWLSIPDPLAPAPTIAGDLGDGNVGEVVDFQYTITASSAYTLTIISGAFPDGLSISQTGHVTGTRTAAGSFVPVFKVTDSAGRSVAKTDPTQTFAAPPVYTGTVSFTAVGGSQDDAVKFIVPRGQWRLAVADIDIANSTLKLYVDNVLVGTKVVPAFSRPGNNIAVGGIDYSNPALSSFRGMLWGAGIFNGSMSQADRDALWNDGAGASFAELAANHPSTMAMIVYAWQLNDAAGSTLLAPTRGAKPLKVDPPTCRRTFVDSRFGVVTALDANGHLLAEGTAAGSDETSSHVAYFAWVFSGALETDSFPSIISRYNGINDPYMGLRSFWVSNT
jgi:hypothetical protein